ncbi:MAG: hypothetical protein OXI86_09475, partial [Candidatus Poribacteria bacterium]|nr:hypothetical protein [Candidatus Poribacteria bacterium]
VSPTKLSVANPKTSLFAGCLIRYVCPLASINSHQLQAAAAGSISWLPQSGGKSLEYAIQPVASHRDCNPPVYRRGASRRTEWQFLVKRYSLRAR